MFKLTIVTPDRRLLVAQEADEVCVPGYRGELNILPGHSPLITTLGTGLLKWKLKGKEKQDLAVISWGYCQVSPDGVSVLANMLDLPEEIDAAAAKESLVQSEKRIVNEVITEQEWITLQREWARARTQVEVAENFAKRQ